MQLNFYATYRQVVGAKSVELPVAQPITVRELIERIVARYPALRRELLDENGNLYSHVHVFINGRDAPYLVEGLDTEIDPDATVNLFPPVAGGAGRGV